MSEVIDAPAAAPASSEPAAAAAAAAPVSAAPAPAAAAAPAAAPAGGSLLARGAGKPGDSPAAEAAPASEEPAASIPEKYLVKREDGTTDYEASALKQAAGYAALAKRLGSGDAPPKSPDEYAPTPPAGLTLDTLKQDPQYTGFLKGAHARGMTNAQVSYVLESMAAREAMRNSPEVAEAELRKVWTSDADMERGLANAYRAVATFADKPLMDRIEAKFANDPDFLVLMAKIAPQLGEDRAAPADLTTSEQETLESILAHPGYFDAKHPEHGRLVAKARTLYAKRTGGA